jgi:hypothetical protein
MTEQTEINNFKRKYFNLSITRYAGHIVHDPKTTKEHRKLVQDICEWATENGLVYYTRVHLKTGKVVDVVIPEISRPFIEVRHSELRREKEYLSEYEDKIQFVDTTDPYKLL